MKTLLPLRPLVALFFMFTCHVPLGAIAQEIIVKGVVTDRNNQGLSGVAIRPETNGRPVGKTVQSDANGNYDVRVKKGQDFDLIYNHTAWHVDTFKRLSGEKDHSINKVLYPVGAEADFSPTVALNILQNYEYVFTAGSMAGKSGEQLRGEFGERLAAIKLLPKTPNDPAVASLLESKRASVFTLFGVR